MLISTNHWIQLNSQNETNNFVQYSTNSYNYTDVSSESQPLWISLSLLSIIIFTIAGNSLVCIAVIRERHLQNTNNYFLTSLAFTDCLVACLVMPLAVTVELIGHFPFDALACNVWLTFDVCCCTSSIWHMSVMSLDRYLTLRYPLKYGRNKRRSLMAYKIITIWLISFAICLPLFILGLIDSSNVYNAETRACFPAHRTFKIYGSFVAFFIPLVIMIVTYALTMSALQQAHTTKKERTKRRARMHAVINLAAMAVRWKRAVNTVEITAEKKLVKEEKVEVIEEKVVEKAPQRKRSSSLLTSQPPKKTIFTSSLRFNQTSKPLSPNHWKKQREKLLKSLPEKSPEKQQQQQQPTTQHLNPNTSEHSQTPTKRSNSCTPLLDVETSRKNQRRSSSVHTLLQIRRDSAKISEELANLTAQLSASMNNSASNSKRPSLSVPGTSLVDEKHTPTIDQLLAETTVNQPILLSTAFLSVNPKKRGRSHSADIRLPIFELSNPPLSSPSAQPIPNLLITHDSIQNIPCNQVQQLKERLTFNNKYQRIKDWIKVTTSSTVLNQNQDKDPNLIPTRCVSAVNVTENTPMLSTSQQYFPPLTNLKRHFPRIEQLYGQTSVPNSSLRPQQQIGLDDHVAAAHNFAILQRSSVCSVTSSTLTARLLRHNRPSTSSSIGSASQAPKRPPRLNDGMSQTSFQMVSLDTDDSSSCTSSLTQHSVNSLRSAMAGAKTTPTTKLRSSRKKRQRFKHILKHSSGNERKAMRVLLIIFSIFVILWTPFFIINLLSCFTEDIHPVLMSIATWLGYCSSCANPIIYTIFSRAFRRAFLDILTCQKVIPTHRASQSYRPSAGSMTLSVGRKLSGPSKTQTDFR